MEGWFVRRETGGAWSVVGVGGSDWAVGRRRLEDREVGSEACQRFRVGGGDLVGKRWDAGHDVGY